MNYTVTVKTGKNTNIRKSKNAAAKYNAAVLAIGKNISRIKAEITSADESRNASILNAIAIIGASVLTLICIFGAILAADFIPSLLFIMLSAALLLLMLELYLVNRHDEK